MLSINSLRVLGLWPKDGSILYYTYSLFMLVSIILHVTAEVIELYFIQHDLLKFTTVLCIMLTGFGALAKMLNLLIRHEKMQIIVQDLQQTTSSAERRITVSTLGIWAGGALLWLCYPIVTSYATDHLPFLAWFPFDTTPGSAGHAAAYIFQAVTGLQAVTIVAAADSFYVGILIELCVQLRNMQETLRRTRLTDDVGVKRLGSCVEQHQNIFSSVQKMQLAFGEVIALQFAFSCFIICTVGFQATLNTVDVTSMVKYLAYLALALIQLLFYCKFGDDLMQESALIEQAAYDCDWFEGTTSEKQALALILLRAQRPFVLTAGGYYTVSLNSFGKILNTSYTYFALLRQLHDE